MVSLEDRELGYPELVAAKAELSIDDLVMRLRDGRGTVRANAALGLAAIGYTGNALVPLLRDGEPRVARAAAEAVAQLGVALKAHVATIAAALDGARPEVVDGVARMFAQLVGVADAELIAVLDSPVAAAAAAILVACEHVGTRGLHLLERAALDGRTRVRINAVHGVALLGVLEYATAMDTLVAVERDADVSDVRAATRVAIAALVGRVRASASVRHKAMGPQAAVVPELELVEATADQLRAAAANAPVQELLRALSDLRTHVRRNAVRIFAAQGIVEPVVARAVAVHLRDLEPSIRVEAAKALIGSPIVADALVAALGDPDPAVVEAVTIALGSQGDAAAAALVDGLETSREAQGARAAMLLGRLGNGAALLRGALASTSVDVRIHAAGGLGALGKRAGVEAVQALGNAAIGNVNARLRAAVAQAIERIEPRPVVALPKLAIDGFDERALAEDALVAAKDKLVAAGPGLAGYLHSTRASTRANAALALGVTGTGQTHALVACLRDDAVGVRAAAVRALALLGDEAIAATARDLVRALADPELAAPIGDALRPRASGAIDAALATALDVPGVLALVCARPTGTAILCAAFAQPGAQEHAARGFVVLGKERLAGGRAVLEAARTATSIYTRELASATLREIDGEAVAPPVPAIAGFETQLLDAVAGKLDPAALLPFLSDGRSIVRANAATALGATGSPAVAASLGALLRDDDLQVRLAVARALDKLGDDAVIAAAPFLVGALRDVRVAGACKAALAPRAAKLVAALIAGLDTPDEAHGMRVAELIVALPDAAELLFAAFDGPADNTTINAALGIGLLGDKRAGVGGKARLRSALTGPITRRHHAAQRALALLGRG